MKNITNLPSCKECNRLLKKKDINENGLCPKCLAKTIDTDIVEASELVPKPEFHEEPLQSGQVTEQHRPTELQNDGQSIENIQDEPEVTQSEDVKPDPTVNEQTDDVLVEVKVKPGQAIREKFMELVVERKITEEYLFELSTKEGTAKFFGVRYPFLKEFNPDVSIKELTYINGHARYSSKPVTIGDRQYLITNDLYKATVPKFMDWSQTLEQK